jgi:hypothetical protein
VVLGSRVVCRLLEQLEVGQQTGEVRPSVGQSVSHQVFTHQGLGAQVIGRYIPCHPAVEGFYIILFLKD